MTMVDLDAPPAPARPRPGTDRPRLASLAATAALAGLVGGALALTLPRPAEAPSPATHVVEFEVDQAAAAVDFAGVGTRGAPVQPVQLEGRHSVEEPAVAVLTITAAPLALTWCRIIVDGHLVTQVTADGRTATCVWQAAGRT